ncbi:hypothetical protein [Nannocystis radixulma]|uniref:Uncharacterized protein n=1 Tax=Nannocystis radixulma TaxID=2995305 RepID=A0ABT5B6J2_9BACT|nr:hypothetical protein [Nannocystis radixulma]MDC0669733.1 hypothetical protein [Nannocystis radixulma]
MNYDDENYLPGGETLAGARKRVLIGVLAERELARQNLELPVERVHEVARWFRARFELITRARTEAFLAHAGLTPERFTAQMRELATLDAIERQFVATIDARLPEHRRLASIRDFLLRQEER